MTKVIIKAADGTGAVEAYHNANKKFETTSTGIAITGDVDVTDAVAEVTVKSTDASAAKLFFNGHGVTAADFGLGHIGGQWNGNDVANIRLESGDDTSNKDDGRIVFSTSDASSTPDERMRIEPNGNVNIGCNTSANPLTYLRFGATQHGAADIRPTDDGSHKVGLAFYVDGTADSTINPAEKLRIQSSGGISFNGDTAAANALNDYEEGHWTITFPNSGTAALQSSNHTKGKYIKVGNLVHFTYFLFFGSTDPIPNNSSVFKHSLPFATAANDTNTYSRYINPVMHYKCELSANVTDLVAYVTTSSSEMKYYECINDGTWNDLKNNQMDDANLRMYVSGTYRTT